MKHRLAAASLVPFLLVSMLLIRDDAHSDPVASLQQPPDPAPAEMFREAEGTPLSGKGAGLTGDPFAAAPTLLAPAAAAPQIPATWVAQGPGPTEDGQVENVTPNDEVVGAVHTVVAHPTDPDVLYLGAVNGGIWRTSNATATSPTWQPLTDDLPSLSIGALEMDPADSQRLLAGIGRFSSFFRAGGSLTGLLLSTDGGNSWSQITDPLLVGQNISGVALRGSTLLASSNSTGSGGLFRSTDLGASWTPVSGACCGLNGGAVFDLVGDPSNANRFYASVAGVGIFRSDDAGATWTRVSINDASTGGVHQTIIGGGNNNTEMAVAGNGRLYAAVLIDGRAEYIGFTDDQGASWTGMDLPITPETSPRPITGATNTAPIVITSTNHSLATGDQVRITGITGNTAANGDFTVTVVDVNDFSLDGSSGNGVYTGGGSWIGFVGLNPKIKPGGQGSIHFSIRADPTNPDTVYVGGERQDLPFPNFIGATNFTGNLWRGDATVAPTDGIPSPQWEHLTHSSVVTGIPGGGTASSSAPHADSREMVFDANGNLIEVDDGGVYRRTSPADNTGDWFSINGNLQTTEFHDVAYDSFSNIIIGGAQDTGTPEQITSGGTTWRSVSTADGGDVAVDDSGTTFSIRYSSFQLLSHFRRRSYTASNILDSDTDIVPIVLGGGDPIEEQFVTPLELNAIEPTRLVIGGSNSVYESMDRGDNVTQITGPGANFGSMAYGHTSNVDLLIVGSGSEVFVRSAAGGALVATPTAYPGDFVRDIVLDPDPADMDVIYVQDTTRVFRTGNAGAGWTDITGNLEALGVGDLRTLALSPRLSGDLLLIGTNAGVFVTAETSQGLWFQLGTNLPNARVFDLDYDADDDILVAGTLGRGAWTLSGITQLTLPSVNFWEFTGIAQGGTIDFTISGVTLQVVTTPGQTAEMVAAAVASAINADPTLAAAGIGAAGNGNQVMTNGQITSTIINDPGLMHTTASVPALSVRGLGLLCLILAGSFLLLRAKAWSPPEPSAGPR